jgi:L-seryl-tRNA(Ser) seleniumtransferase
MQEAARLSVPIEELQAAAGAYIAEVTGAQAGYVTTGSAAGLTLAAAACIAGLDPARMDRLPDTDGIPNEIIVHRSHQVAYNHALRAAGARLVEVGYIGYPGVGATYPWQVESAITNRTVAFFFQLVDAPNVVGLEEFAEIAHRHGLPLIVDAAGALPPAENLIRLVASGGDLVAFSGGKAIGGPQASGILCGRADLIQSVALQHQDMDVPPPLWGARGHTGPLPHHGIGRSMKVGKEEIVGLVAALRA